MSRKFFVKDTDYATEDTAGVVKVGEGLSIDSDGILKVIGEGGTNYQDLVELVVPTITLSGLKYTTILEDNNYTVTFTCGDKVVKKRTNGEDTMKIDAPKLGTWTATCIPDRDRTYSASVNVAALGNAYSMTMNMSNVYDFIRKNNSMTYSAESVVATTVGDYALFGGGRNSGSPVYTYASVSAHNSDLVQSSAPDLSKAKVDLAATTVGNYALFGGGWYSYNSSSNQYLSSVDAYSSDLVQSSAPQLTQSKERLAAVSVGDYALFGGGDYYGGDTCYATVDAYNSSLIKSSAPQLNEPKYSMVSTTIGDYALFGGGTQYKTGIGYTSYNVVEVYTSDLVKTSAPNLSTRSLFAATTVGNYALFGGSSTVDAYNSNLVKSSASNLSESRSSFAATTVGNYALFGGGSNSSSCSDIVDVYNSNLVKISAPNLNQARSYLAATTVGNYALFGGGYNTLSSSNHISRAIDAFRLIDTLPPTE